MWCQMAKLSYDSILQDLKARKSSISCSELISYLEFLGFVLRPGKNGNHYTFTHAAIDSFEGGSFDGRHAKDAAIKLPYIVKVIGVLTKYEDAIKK